MTHHLVASEKTKEKPRLFFFYAIDKEYRKVNGLFAPLPELSSCRGEKTNREMYKMAAIELRPHSTEN